MTKYKAGALTAFLSGKELDEAEGDSGPSQQLVEKKPKKKQKLKRAEEPSPSDEEPATAKDTADEVAGTDSATPSRRKNQSYAKIMDDDEKKRTVFIGNLPVDVTRKALKRLFSPCGAVASTRLRSAIPKKPHLPKKAAVIKRELSEGQTGLIAYVKFQAPESVQEALKLNGTVVDGRHIQVDSCASGKRYDDKRTVFLGNLPFDATEDALYDHFSACGNIDKVRLVRDRNSGQGKGFGFVVFKDPTSVSFALKLNGEKFDNRELRITRVVKKQKKKLADSTSSSSSRRPTKNLKMGARKARRDGSNSKRSGSTPRNVQQKRPSKRVRELVKKRKAKKDRKSYMSTF